jgi:hypothetical protein
VNDAATQGCVLQILFYLRQIALDSAAKVLVKGGFVAGTEAAKQESNQDKTRDGYNELGVLLLREIPRTQRLDSRHYANILLSMRLGEITRIFQDPESATYEGNSGHRNSGRDPKTGTGGLKPEEEGGHLGAPATQVLEFLSRVEDVILFLLSIG